ncbi:MAG: PhoH family protein [Sphingomonadales bacterium]
MRPAASGDRLVLDFEDNRLLPLLFGQYDSNLARIEQMLGVVIISRGNRLQIEGDGAACRAAESTLNDLYMRLQTGQNLEPGDVDGAVRLASADGADGRQGPGGEGEKGARVQIDTRKRLITARSTVQEEYIRHLMHENMIFSIGPAGTGKTYLAVAAAVAKLLAGEVDRIILSRPAVEAGENLGFLPGDLKEKVDPYLRPLYDALYDTLPAGQVEKRFQSGQIEIAPLAFMRGRTLSNAFVILDEAQNTTAMQMKMFLTRFGDGSQMVIAGDPSQVDLPDGAGSGLRHALGVLDGLAGVVVVQFTERDVVRHPLVGQIVKAYDKYESENDKSRPKGRGGNR